MRYTYSYLAIVIVSMIVVVHDVHARETIFTSTSTIATSTNAYTINQAVLDALLEIKNLEHKVNIPAVVLPIARVKETSWNTFQFDASSTYSSREGLLTYLWNFGDGGIGRDTRMTHTYKSGKYHASLQVADTTGVIKELSFPIEVRFWDFHNRSVQLIAAALLACALGLVTFALIRR